MRVGYHKKWKQDEKMKRWKQVLVDKVSILLKSQS